MGRKRKGNFDDPPRLHKKGKVWYHVSGTTPRVWTKLSSDRAEALRMWAQREGVREDDSTKTVSVIVKRYIREVYPTKAVRTRADNDKELIHLLRVFGHMPIDAIAPMHIREYMDLRGQVAKVRANREKALFSHIFNKAREWGYTALQNPCQGVMAGVNYLVRSASTILAGRRRGMISMFSVLSASFAQQGRAPAARRGVCSSPRSFPGSSSDARVGRLQPASWPARRTPHPTARTACWP